MQHLIIYRFCYFSFLAQCPTDHPFAYLNGGYCCKTREERPVNLGITPQNQIDDGTCDGLDFNSQSACCRDEAYTPCPHASGCFDSSRVNCQWSSWSSPSSCTKICGGGTLTETRHKIVKENRGGTCSGATERKTECNTEACIWHCAWHMFKCANNACVSSSLLCDGVNDCGDNSDETCGGGSCEEDLDCGIDGKCINNKCFQTCEDNNDCTHEDHCVNNMCLPKPSFSKGFRTVIGQFPEENSNEKTSNQGLNIQVNGVSVENHNLRLMDNEQGDLVIEDLSKILKTLDNKGYIIR